VNPEFAICATKTSRPTRLWPGDAAAIIICCRYQCTTNPLPMLTTNGDPEHSERWELHQSDGTRQQQRFRSYQMGKDKSWSRLPAHSWWDESLK
jgi:hypothetical protein